MNDLAAVVTWTLCFILVVILAIPFLIAAGFFFKYDSTTADKVIGMLIAGGYMLIIYAVIHIYEHKKRTK